MSEQPERNLNGIETEKVAENSNSQDVGADAAVSAEVPHLAASAQENDTALTVAPSTELKFKKNKLQLFPQSIRDQMDVLIHAGRGGAALLTFLKLNYRGSLELPSINTCVKYVAMRREELKGDNGELQIQRIMAKKMDFSQVPKGDKRAMLQAVIDFMAWRIEQIKLLTEHLKSPQYERIITDDTRVILETITKQIALEKEFGINAERVRAILTVLFRHIGVRVQQAYTDVQGNDKIEQFVGRLSQLMEELPIEAIEKEATEAFDKTDQGGDLL